MTLNTGTSGCTKKSFTPEEIGERMRKFRDYIGGTVDLTKWVVAREYENGATVFENYETGAVVSLNTKE